MTTDQFAESFEKWESRFQKSSVDEWAVQPVIAQEVQIGVRAHREKYGDAPARAIDIGAGDGRHTVYLAQQGFEVLAVDAAPSGVALIRQKLAQENQSAELVVADLRTYDYPTNFDLVLASYIIHLLPDPLEQLKKWQAATRPGGVCVVGTRGQFEHDQSHYWFPANFELRRRFEEAGWFVIHAREEDNWRPDMGFTFRQKAVVAIKPE